MRIHQLRRPVVLALVVAGALALALYPAGRRRASLVKQRMAGWMPVGWRQLAVGMVPGASLRASLRDYLEWGPRYWVQSLRFPEDPTMGFQMHPIYQGPTPSVSEFESHFSTLQAGETPHTPHHHREEELIILMSGHLKVIRVDAGTGERTEHPVAPGEMIYHASDSIHTLRSEGPGTARYLILKWVGAPTPSPQTVLSSKTIPYQPAFGGHVQSAEGFTSTVVFESPTRYLRKLHCHVSTVRPGAGYDAHDDNYDVAIVLLKGTVETVGQRIKAPSVIFYSADHPHGLRNPGDSPAEYVVFEFHGPIDL